LSIFVWINFYWWIARWGGERTFAENKAVFLNRFPSQLQNGTVVQALNMVLTGLSIYLFQKARKDVNFKIGAIVLIVLNSILFLFGLFSLS
jgi:hypothetical protein